MFMEIILPICEKNSMRLDFGITTVHLRDTIILRLVEGCILYTKNSWNFQEKEIFRLMCKPEDPSQDPDH